MSNIAYLPVKLAVLERSLGTSFKNHEGCLDCRLAKFGLSNLAKAIGLPEEFKILRTSAHEYFIRQEVVLVLESDSFVDTKEYDSIPLVQASFENDKFHHWWNSSGRLGWPFKKETLLPEVPFEVKE